MRSCHAAALLFGCAFVWTAAAPAQFRGGADWITAGGDAQRSFWMRSDPKISAESLRAPGFQMIWKIKLNHDASRAATLSRYIGYRGFRALAFVGSVSGEIIAIDTDLGRIEWKKSLTADPAPGAAAPGCPAGVTANLTGPTTAAFPAAPAAGGSSGRSGPAKSGVGQPDEGAVTIAEIAAREAMARNGGRGGRGPESKRMPAELNAISADGMFHSLNVSNGEEPAASVPFLPPHANARGLTVIDNIAYATTSHGCGGAPNGVWALDLASKESVHWAAAGDVAGGPAFGPDGTVYATTNRGELVALDAKTLQPKATYRSSGQAFTTSPLVFQYKSKTMIVAATKDNRLHLVDAGSLTGAAWPAAVSGALASWEDPAGTRWIAAPSKDSITAWRVADQSGTPVLQPGWTSREMASPLGPIAINGVIFSASNSSAPVLDAFDGATGKELWNSGRTMAAPVRYGGLSGSAGQLYLETSDGTIYAFGFPIEH